jgi:hypothetical protein
MILILPDRSEIKVEEKYQLEAGDSVIIDDAEYYVYRLAYGLDEPLPGHARSLTKLAYLRVPSMPVLEFSPLHRE